MLSDDAWENALAWNLNSGYPNSVDDKATINGFAVAAPSGTVVVGKLVVTSSGSLTVGSSSVFQVSFSAHMNSGFVAHA